MLSPLGGSLAPDPVNSHFIFIRAGCTNKKIASHMQNRRPGDPKSNKKGGYLSR